MKDINKKIEEQFASLNISLIYESKEQFYLYADYVELVCIISNNYVSSSDIVDRLTDNGLEFKLEKEKLDGQIGQIEAEIKDVEEGWISNIFEYLNERSSLFKKSYPFIVDNNGIKLINEKLSSQQRLYIYFLISSSLKFFHKLKHELISEFEIISEKALKAFLPQSIVHGFGANSAYKGSARAKIKELAKDINLAYKERIVNQVSKYNSKEEGLDVVGWIPFNDNNPNTIIILGQCACGQNWIGKQNETRRYDRFYDSYILPFIHALFVPHDLKNAKGKFNFDKDINNNTLVFERLRLIELLGDFKFDETFKSKLIVDKCLEYEEGLV